MFLTHIVALEFLTGASPYSTVEAVAALPEELPSGVGKGRVIHLQEIQPSDRQSTADYIKQLLATRQGIAELPATRPKRKPRAKRKAERLAEEALRGMEIERENQIRILRDNNNRIIALLLMSGM